MENLIYGIIGLCMFTGQVFATIIMFGGWKTMPKWLRICTGVALIFMFLCIIGLTVQ